MTPWALRRQLRPIDHLLGPPAHGADRAGIAFLDRLDQLRHFLRGLGRALGQLPDLVGYYGEATTLFAGSCCLDLGVESKKVGLAGDVLDGAHYPADLCRALAHLLHLAGGFLHDSLNLLHSGHGRPHCFESLFRHGPARSRLLACGGGALLDPLGGIGDCPRR